MAIKVLYVYIYTNAEVDNSVALVPVEYVYCPGNTHILQELMYLGFIPLLASLKFHKASYREPPGPSLLLPLDSYFCQWSAAARNVAVYSQINTHAHT